MITNFAYPLIGSEISLALYPQLIKLVPASIEVQLAVRCITYSSLALMGFFINNIKKTKLINSNQIIDTKSKSGNIFYYILMGIINIIHIASSYISYTILPSGIAYSLFYTYPIFNLISRSIFFGESILFINYIYIIIAIIGVYFVYYNKNIDTSNIDTSNIDTSNIDTSNIDTSNIDTSNIDTINNKKNKIKQSNNFLSQFTPKDRLIGLFSGITSAFSESLIYLMIKADFTSISPFVQIIKTYLLGGILSIFYLIKNLKKINLDLNYWITLILFNLIVGFVGHIIRFFTIPRISTLMFNSLSFLGVIFSYFWGYVFSKEKINLFNILGTILILYSVYTINK